MGQQAPFRFIHVGLGKCASTYLKSVWLTDSQYQVAESKSLIGALREIASDGGKRLALRAPSHAGDASWVMSSEGFTWGWINQPPKQGRIKDLQKMAARTIGDSGLTAQILVMIRHPLDWLRSAHEQSVKEGAHAGWREFFHDQRLFCESVLDLDHLVHSFQMEVDKVVVLSLDELRREPDSFWTRYSCELGVPRPMGQTLEAVEDKVLRVNRSVNERLSILARFNEFRTAFLQTMESLEAYKEHLSEEADRMIPKLREDWLWANRRIIEFASDQQLEELMRQLRSGEQGQFGEVEIDEAMAEWVEERFLAPLEESGTVPVAFIQEYRQDVQRAVSKST